MNGSSGTRNSHSAAEFRSAQRGAISMILHGSSFAVYRCDEDRRDEPRGVGSGRAGFDGKKLIHIFLVKNPKRSFAFQS